MKKIVKKITIDDLAIMVAKGFEDVKSELKSEINEVKENIRITRNDVLNIGDKFVSHHTFDQLANRVNTLEKKAKIK